MQPYFISSVELTCVLLAGSKHEYWAIPTMNSNNKIPRHSSNKKYPCTGGEGQLKKYRKQFEKTQKTPPVFLQKNQNMKSVMNILTRINV